MKEHGADSGDKLGLCSQIRKETVKKGDRAITGYPDQGTLIDYRVINAMTLHRVNYGFTYVYI